MMRIPENRVLSSSALPIGLRSWTQILKMRFVAMEMGRRLVAAIAMAAVLVAAVGAACAVLSGARFLTLKTATDPISENPPPEEDFQDGWTPPSSPPQPGPEVRKQVHHYMLWLYSRTALTGGVGDPAEEATRLRPPADVVRAVAPRTSVGAAISWGEEKMSVTAPPASIPAHLLLRFQLPPPRAGERMVRAELRLWVAPAVDDPIPRGGRQSPVWVWRQTAGGRRLPLGAMRPGEGGALTLDVSEGAVGGGAPGRRLLLWLGTPTADGVRLHPHPAAHPLLLLHFNDTASQAQKTPFPSPLMAGAVGEAWGRRGRRGPRRRRSAEAEDYEEVSNAVWSGGAAVGVEAGAGEGGRGRTGRGRVRGRGGCRRRPLRVDFAEINYDTWILAPPAYEAFQCVGRCGFPVAAHLSPTKHAVLQALIHSASPERVGRACCVPVRLDPISVLFLDEDGVLTYRFSYADMAVAECGCR